MRISSQLLDALFITALYSRDRGYTFRDATANVADNWSDPNDPNKTEVQRQFILSTTRYLPGRVSGRLTFDQILDESGTIIKGTNQQGPGEGDLVDALSQVLQSPYAQNYLTRDILANLRKAILLPEERGKFISTTSPKELSCGQCAERFAEGEMSTFANGAFYCRKCMPPTAARCASCGKEAAPLAEKLRSIIAKGNTCPACEGKPLTATTAGAGAAQAPPPFQRAPEQRFVRPRPGGGRGGGVRAMQPDDLLPPPLPADPAQNLDEAARRLREINRGFVVQAAPRWGDGDAFAPFGGEDEG